MFNQTNQHQSLKQMDSYLTIKSLHIIFVVTWFAGLFYMFRLFVYHAESSKKTEPARSILIEQLSIMEKKLWYIITWPSCLLTLIFGTWLLLLNIGLLANPWMHIKLFFVALLLAYQFYGQKVLKKINENPETYSSISMRLWNEVPTVILIAIVFLVVLKSEISWIWGTLGILGTIGLLTAAIFLYRRSRNKQ
jgi:protoporphyrinogen IX oxidase